MSDLFEKKYLKNKRSGIANLELGVLGFVIAILVLSFPELQNGCRMNDLFSNNSVFDNGSGTDQNAMDMCVLNTTIRFLCYSGMLTLFLNAICLASPLRSTFGMKFSGLYATQGDTQDKPSFSGALRYAFLSNFVFLIAFSYAAYHDFNLRFSEIGTMSVFLLFLGLFLPALNRLLPWEETVSERISGLRLHLCEKDVQKHDKYFARYRLLYKVHYYLGNILIIPSFLLIGYMLLNALSIGSKPDDYDEAIYKPAFEMVWEDNAYIAFSGLNAPAGYDNTYDYGLKHVQLYAREYSQAKSYFNVPYPQPVPDIHDPIDQDDPAERLKVTDQDTRWSCFYALPYDDIDEEACKDEDLQDIYTFINENSELWQRYNSLPDYEHFVVPDVFLSSSYSGQSFITLSQVKAASIVGLADDGQTDLAVREWVRFMALYQKMLGAETNMVEKAIFNIAMGAHLDAIETLLYRHPDIVKTHKDIIYNSLTTRSFKDFRAEFLLRDDWRLIASWVEAYLGDMPHKKRQIYACILSQKEKVNLPAADMIVALDGPLCPEIFDGNFNFQKSIFSKGEPISNIIWDLLMGGLMKGHELIKNMHYMAVHIDMTRYALEILNDERDIESLPEPYEWKEEDNSIYYPITDDEEYHVRRRVFKINNSLPVKD